MTGRFLCRLFEALRRDQGGAVALIVVGGIVSLLGFTALSVDLGATYLEARNLQGLADSAALAAVAAPDSAQSTAAAVIAASGRTAPYALDIVPGSYTPDATVAAADRFVPGVGSGAARASITGAAPLRFARLLIGRDSFSVRRTATAARIDLAAFSLGSRLASLNGGVANAVTSALIGGTVNLSVMDYTTLASADVNVLAFTDALRTRVHLEGASYDTVLATRTTLPVALGALGDALASAGDTTAAAAAARLASAATATPFTPADVIALGPYGENDETLRHANISVSAYQMIAALAEWADGARQIKLSLGATVPGLAGTTLWLAIGEPMAQSPWLALTRDGTPVVRTAQARLYVQAGVAPASGLGLLGIVNISLPIYIELASAQAKLSSLSCTGGATNAQIGIDAMPSLGQIAIATIDTTKLDSFETTLAESPATIVSAPLVTVAGQATSTLGGAGWQSLSFTGSDVSAGRIKTVQTDDLVGATTASLASSLHLTVSVAGLGLNASLISGLVGTSLTAAAPAVDTLLDQLEAMLGLGLGEADVQVNGVRCGTPVLVG